MGLGLVNSGDVVEHQQLQETRGVVSILKGRGKKRMASTLVMRLSKETDW